MFQLILSVFLLLCFFNTANSTLISANDGTFGNGSITIDTATNLAWLDLSITTGISFNDISNELGVGGIYSGYRFASPEEVFSLFLEALIPDINSAGNFGHYGTLANAEPALSLIELLGASYQVKISGVTLSEVAGFSSQHVLINGFDLIQMPYAIVREGVITLEGSQSFGEVFTDGTFIFPSNSYEGVGSWLVKPVDIVEPTSIALFGLGLVGFSFFKKKEKGLKHANVCCSVFLH